ncbi:MAG: hypothetical protein ACM3WV_04535 [Bacillota bacterium]
MTAGEKRDVLIRPKDAVDGAVLSENSLMMLNFLKLSRITGVPFWEQKAMHIATAFGSQVRKYPMAHIQFLCALDFAPGPAFEVVVVQGTAEEKTGKCWGESTRLLSRIKSSWLCRSAVKKQSKKSPGLLKTCETSMENPPFMYAGIIKGQSQTPTTDVEKVMEMLQPFIIP